MLMHASWYCLFLLQTAVMLMTKSLNAAIWNICARKKKL